MTRLAHSQVLLELMSLSGTKMPPRLAAGTWGDLGRLVLLEGVMALFEFAVPPLALSLHSSAPSSPVGLTWHKRQLQGNCSATTVTAVLLVFHVLWFGENSFGVARQSLVAGSFNSVGNPHWLLGGLSICLHLPLSAA